MKIVILIPLLATLASSACFAEERIYRCGNEYTNTVTEAQAKNCKLVSGGNVTVVPANRPAGNRAASSPQAIKRVESAEQRAKDSDSRLILESELKKAQARQAELLKEYNNGDPEKLGAEHKNNQKYLDRIEELKANIARNESDISGIRRELNRINTGTPSRTAEN